MSAGLALALTAVALLVVGLVVFAVRRELERKRQEQSLLRWEHATRASHSDSRDESVDSLLLDASRDTDPNPDRVQWAPYKHELGFEIMFPRHWSVAGDTITCPEDELTYKRITLGVENVAWLFPTPRALAEHVRASLPAEQTTVDEEGPVTVGRFNAHELVYTVRQARHSLQVSHTVVFVGDGRAVAVTFGAEPRHFARYRPLARRVLHTFRMDAAPSVRGEAPGVVRETPPDPARCEWAELAVPAHGVSVRHPARWTAHGDAAKGALRFTCSRDEASYKSFSVFLIDLSSAASVSGDLLQPLAQYYVDEVARQRNVRLVDRRRRETADGRPVELCKTEGSHGAVPILAHTLLGLHGASQGHIVTFSAAADVAAAYAPLRDALLESLIVA